MDFVDRMDHNVTKYMIGIGLVPIAVKYSIGIHNGDLRLVEWLM